MRLDSSFRDPAGYLIRMGGRLLRQVTPEYWPILDRLHATGLYADLTEAGLLIQHQEVAPAVPGLRSLEPVLVPTISYPYEWCFSQLKDAALTTLDIHRRAMGHGLQLKDASAYNIQFLRGRPTLIDTLSFEAYEEGSPWRAYRQFCEHFLAPLSLMAHVDPRLGKLLQIHLDGIPLDLAAKLLPRKTLLSPGLAIHIHLHAKAQGAGHSSSNAKNSFGKAAMLGLIDSLRSTIEKLRWTPKGTVWGDYYESTNYSAPAMQRKRSLVAEFLTTTGATSVWDLGANTGEFSQIASSQGIRTVAWDFDVAAVEKSYRQHKADACLLSLSADLTNPSPSIGWSNRERESFQSRCNADALMALALIHHLAIGNNVPLPAIADFFADLAPWLIIEFVPKSDSQVQRLLSSRDDIYAGYHEEGFEQAFATRHDIVRREPIQGSDRTLYLLKRK